MRSTDDYVSKIPPLNAGKPKFVETVRAMLAPLADIQTFLAALPSYFDIDTAIGAQLDIVGQWVGQSRNITIPVSQPWFAWDTALRGWGEGYWRGPNIFKNYITQLDDDMYRRLLYAIILANNGEGDVASAQAALDRYFIDTSTLIFVLDVSVAVGLLQPFSWDTGYGRGWDQGYWRAAASIAGETIPALPVVDMRWTIGVAGKIPSIVDLEILAQEIIDVIPAGVVGDIKVVTVDNTALFGWDMTSNYVSGWGVGSWGADPDYVARNVLSS